jgi:glyoxylase I family protein
VRTDGDTLAVINGMNHVGFTVRDVTVSAAWYEEVLGFERVGSFQAPDGARRKIFLRHDGVRTRLGLTSHRDGDHSEFDELRVGLDHLAFGVDTRDELDAWADRLDRANVRHAAVQAANSIPGAFVLVFRDPDNIQLELFYDPTSSTNP